MQKPKYFSTPVLLLILLMTWGISIPIQADPEVNAADFDYDEAAIVLADYLIDRDFLDLEDLNDECQCEVKIYNEKNELVRFGKADNHVVKALLSRADYLAQVDHVKYFILNK